MMWLRGSAVDQVILDTLFLGTEQTKGQKLPLLLEQGVVLLHVLQQHIICQIYSPLDIRVVGPGHRAIDTFVRPRDE